VEIIYEGILSGPIEKEYSNLEEVEQSGLSAGRYKEHILPKIIN